MLCADIDGLSLHAAVRCGADDRQALEQLCRSITRPGAGQRLGSDQRGRTGGAEVEDPLARRHHAPGDEPAGVPCSGWRRGRQKGAFHAPVPRPWLHLIRFHGVLAPNAKLRSLVMPQGPPAHAEPASEAAAAAKCEVEAVEAPVPRISWARLLKRVFAIDIQHCPNCGGELKIIAAILERPAIEKVLAHLGLDPQPPPRGRAPEPELQFAA